MVGMIRKLLADRGPELARRLVTEAGLRSDEATGFLPGGAERLLAALGGGEAGGAAGGRAGKLFQ